MTWQDGLTIASVFVSLAVLLGGALGRETVGELKRRVAILETHNEARSREVAALDERSKGQTEALKRIETSMVPRGEWEARHRSTDERLDQILSLLSQRESNRDRDSVHS